MSGDAELEMRRVSDEPHTGSGYSETSDTKHEEETEERDAGLTSEIGL